MSVVKATHCAINLLKFSMDITKYMHRHYVINITCIILYDVFCCDTLANGGTYLYITESSLIIEMFTFSNICCTKHCVQRITWLIEFCQRFSEVGCSIIS